MSEKRLSDLLEIACLGALCAIVSAFVIGDIFLRGGR